MPITYGEGEENVRRRLQAKIEAASSALLIIIFLQNESFVSCKAQLAKLKANLFSNNQTTTTLAIVRLCGTGKSQRALEAAYRTRLNSKDCSVFWMDKTDVDSLYRSYASVAQKLNIPGCEEDQADMKQDVRCCVAEVRKLLLP